MIPDNTLKDTIPLDEVESNGSKNILTIVALLIIVVVVAIILQKDVLANEKKESLVVKNDNPLMISSKLQTVKTAEKELLSMISKPKKEVTVEVEQEKYLYEEEDEVSNSPIIETIQTPSHIKKNTLSLPTIKNTPMIKKDIYYIQIGSYTKTPTKRFLSAITKYGFKYIITPPSSKGIKKIFIGPYPSKSVATSNLSRVKDTLNKGAFIIKK